MSNAILTTKETRYRNPAPAQHELWQPTIKRRAFRALGQGEIQWTLNGCQERL